MLHRQLTIDQLLPLLKACEAAEQEIGTVAASLPEVTAKTQFIRYWQKHAECISDLEGKIRAHGGSFDAIDLKRIVAAPSSVGPQNRLVSVIQVEENLLQSYRTALRGDLPVDVRMLLERHAELFKEVISYATAALKGKTTDKKLTA